jgi:F0F1-type ATP synthase membrane subunit c/vacuolar-type H+-ATPase subunit K
MGKRIMLMVVGAGLGVGLGVIASSLGTGNIALVIGGVLGAVIPLVWLGEPGR